MNIQNEKCCFMQYPYPENSVFFIAIGEKYELSVEDILSGNTEKSYNRYMNSLKNIHAVARSEEDAINEIKENTNGKMHIYGMFSLEELKKITQGNFIPETYVLSLRNRTINLESFYYKNSESQKFIKIQSDSYECARDYLTKEGHINGLLISESDIFKIYGNMKLVQEGKVFGHYCLSQEEELEEEMADEAVYEKV